jgi:hypothetical protein
MEIIESKTEQGIRNKIDSGLPFNLSGRLLLLVGSQRLHSFAELLDAVKGEHFGIVPPAVVAVRRLPGCPGHEHNVIALDEHGRVVESVVSTRRTTEHLPLELPRLEVGRAEQVDDVAGLAPFTVGESPVLVGHIVILNRELAVVRERRGVSVRIELGLVLAVRVDQARRAIATLGGIDHSTLARQQRDPLVARPNRDLGDSPAVDVHEVGVDRG